MALKTVCKDFFCALTRFLVGKSGSTHARTHVRTHSKKDKVEQILKHMRSVGVGVAPVKSNIYKIRKLQTSKMQVQQSALNCRNIKNMNLMAYVMADTVTCDTRNFPTRNS